MVAIPFTTNMVPPLTRLIDGTVGEGQVLGTKHHSATIRDRQAKRSRNSRAWTDRELDYSKDKDPLAIRLASNSDATLVDVSYKPPQFHWMDVCQEKFDILKERRCKPSLSASTRKCTDGNLRSLREITLQIVVDYYTSLTPDILRPISFFPVGQLIWKEIVRQGKDSLRVYSTFVERFPREMSQYEGEQVKRKKVYQAVRRLKLGAGMPHDFVDQIGACMNWLVYVDIYDVASATTTRNGLISLLHIPTLVGLKFGVRKKHERFGSDSDVLTLDDSMLKIYASAMKHDGRWPWLRTLIMLGADGNVLPGVTQEGMNAIMGVKGRLRYVECHQDLMPVPFRQGRLEGGKLVGESDGRPDGGWMSLRAWPNNSVAALHWKCLKIAKIVHDQISELDQKPMLDVSIATPTRMYQNMNQNSFDRDFIIDGYVLSFDDRSEHSGKRPGAINNEQKATKRRRGIVPKCRTSPQSLDQMMASFLS
ncbi:hypothetical protein V1525DRAFT_433866 [Lipomyces kononenkoae]|uniref:Uncharacterized protein n=1 Tax=Lipomyces kononenkoae TaxID=34357 RepID=A0ACC3SXY6_LIPKO